MINLKGRIFDIVIVYTLYLQNWGKGDILVYEQVRRHWQQKRGLIKLDL
jgi:hypothetical protein